MTTRSAKNSESIFDSKIISAIACAFIFLSSVLMGIILIVPSAIAERGYMAFGGEWFLIFGLSCLITYCAMLRLTKK